MDPINYIDLNESYAIYTSATGEKYQLNLSGLDSFSVDQIVAIKKSQNNQLFNLIDFENKDIYIKNDKFTIALERSGGVGTDRRFYLYQSEPDKSLRINLGNRTIENNQVYENYVVLKYKDDVLDLDKRLTINGTGVLLSGQGGGGGGGVSLPNTIVYTTGNQTISGIKTFTETGSFNTLQITNKKLSSYSLESTDFIFGDNYLNFANSSSNIIGTLPSGIVSGINYYVKNLNTGILLITGSGQRTIDGFSTVNLYKNESLQLVGVNNLGYTGWVTISADGGIS